MSGFSKAIESILKSFGKQASKEISQNASKQGLKSSTPAQKQIHKEQRGIYNVTYNNKIATYIKTDLDSIENAIRYARGNKNKGAKHIKLGHTLDSKQEGYISNDELLNLGKNIRQYLQKHKEPFIDKDGSRIYEWTDKNGNKFRAVSSFKKFSESGGGANSSITTTANTEHIITFYSNRNLPKDKVFEFKNPKLQESNNLKSQTKGEILQEITPFTRE